MAKARSRTAARKIKDKWKAKSWYNILAPASFDNVTVADTLSDNPKYLINRVTEVSLQDLTNDFRKSHIKLFFKINKIEESNASTQYIGHTLTSDYLRRMIRRKRSKIDGIYDVSTRDGAIVRIKPFATTDKRIQNSQRKIVRLTMKKTISDQAKNNTLSEFIKSIIEGKMGSEIYKNCKKLYPVKRVEIQKTHVLTQPTVIIEEKKKVKTKDEEPEKSDEKEKKTTKKTTKKIDEKPELEEEKTKIEESNKKEESKKTPSTNSKQIKESTKQKESDKKKKQLEIVDESAKEESIENSNQNKKNNITKEKDNKVKVTPKTKKTKNSNK